MLRDVLVRKLRERTHPAAMRIHSQRQSQDLTSVHATSRPKPFPFVCALTTLINGCGLTCLSPRQQQHWN